LRLKVADPTGLCFGVRRAIEQLESTLKEHGPVHSLGSPIHNPQEIERLSRLGLVVAERPEDVPQGSVAFVRAHGVGPRVLEALRERCRLVVDGTCPFVRTAQERAMALSRKGFPVVLVGDRDHPEVRGILGYVGGEAWVVGGVEEIRGDMRRPRLGVLSQTTQKEADLSAVVARLVSLVSELRVFNTICRATLERQEAVRRLAPEVEGILVIGGKNSANTRKLAEIARDAGADTLWIEHAGELDGRWLEGKGSLGVAAGGSTPDWLILETLQRLEKM
jgi:4-hydroxy-3-methylbut-2-enyl diphosphate reductase